MSNTPPVLKIKLQVFCGEEIAMGPGKALLLEAIDTHGSISAAARAIGMSYRRAWLLVDVMNRCWTKPLVETAPGGTARAGARVTPFGSDVLRWFRAMQEQAEGLCDGDGWSALQRHVRGVPKDHR